jgi:hypothetical protein
MSKKQRVERIFKEKKGRHYIKPYIYDLYNKDDS